MFDKQEATRVYTWTNIVNDTRQKVDWYFLSKSIDKDMNITEMHTTQAIEFCKVQD